MSIIHLRCKQSSIGFSFGEEYIAVVDDILWIAVNDYNHQVCIKNSSISEDVEWFNDHFVLINKKQEDTPIDAYNRAMGIL